MFEPLLLSTAFCLQFSGRNMIDIMYYLEQNTGCITLIRPVIKLEELYLLTLLKNSAF